MTDDHRRHAPATARNREAILAVLQRHLPSKGNVLEIASGSGEHILYFAQASSSDLVFQPTDLDEAARASIDAWVASCGVSNVRRAIELDATGEVWPVSSADAVLCINMVHIAPWAATEGLVRGAARILPAQGILYLYGPYRFGGRHTASSNEAFDADLRRRNPEWGVRDVEAVVDLATAHGFQSPMIEQMPANNVSLVFRRMPR
jgi:SAM-dependent methyltransferase